MPFAWERLWLNGPLPERLVCHARLRRETPETAGTESESASAPETLTGDLWFYSTGGVPLGGLTGFAVKRANRSSLFSSTESLEDLLYEVAWRDRPLRNRLRPAIELAAPSAVAAETDAFAEYLAREGVQVPDRAALLGDLEQLSRAYSLAALDKLGWRRRAGEVIDPEELAEEIGVIPQHCRLLERMLRLLSDAGVLEKAPGGQYRVLLERATPCPAMPWPMRRPLPVGWLNFTPTGQSNSVCSNGAEPPWRRCFREMWTLCRFSFPGKGPEPPTITSSRRLPGPQPFAG